LLTTESSAWRCDIDWTIGTTDIPPLYNELFVQEDLGSIAPSYPTKAYGASDMVEIGSNKTCYGYDKSIEHFYWCGSTVVGLLDAKRVSYGVQWLSPAVVSDDDSVPDVEADYVQLPDFGGGLNEMRVTDVSSDGNIMVGYGNNRRGPLAFRTNSAHIDAETSTPIPKTLTIQDTTTMQTLQTTKALAVSSDGFIIAGTGYVKQGARAFVTTVLGENYTSIELESTILPMIGGGRFAEATAITTDGDYIAGRCDSPKGPQACIWFKNVAADGVEEWVVKGLGALAEQSFDSTATGITHLEGVSEVGNVMVIGYSSTNLYASEAFVWSGNVGPEYDIDEEASYFYDLEYILTKTGVGEISGMGSDWVLTAATGISAAGDRIVGWGVNPEGNIEAFVVTNYPAFQPLIFTHE